MPIRIRPVLLTDDKALSQICLLTGDAGKSAASLHAYPELPGLVYAVPYNHMPNCFGFVLEDVPDAEGGVGDGESEGKGEVVGYILGACDTTDFLAAAERDWYPPLRSRYPDLRGPSAPAAVASTPSPTDADKHYFGLIHRPDPAPPACLAFAPAHLHIDILPAYQRQGWGRRLISTAIEHLRMHGASRVYLGMDPRNADAARFYERLGFKAIEGAPSNCVGLKFEDFV